MSDIGRVAYRSSNRVHSERSGADFVLRSDAEANAVLRDAAELQTSVTWTDALGGEGSGLLILTDDQVRLRAHGNGPLGSIELSLVVYDLPVVIRCDLDADRLHSPGVRSTESRRSIRVAAADSSSLEWFAVEAGAMVSHVAPLLDLSMSGARSLHGPGMPVPESSTFAANILTPRGFSQCMVTVVSRRETARGTELGLRLHVDELAPLAAVVINSLFPQVTQRRCVEGHALRELLSRSNYLSLRDGTEPSAAWLKLDADEISRDFVYVGDDGVPVGHGSITRAYRNAWLAHQIATVSDHDQSVDARRALYMCLTLVPTLLDEGRAGMLAYFDSSKSWHDIFFAEFAHSVASPAIAVVTKLQRFERSNAPLSPIAVPDGIEVGPAHARELAIVAGLARAQLPALLCELYDLEPAKLRASALHPAYHGSECQRSREVIVVRVQGRIVGAALCELSGRELSLFNIMNMAHVFVVDSTVPAAAQRALQDAVRAFYLAHDVSDPLLVSPVNSFDGTLDPETKLAEVMGCIAWSSEGLRAYENYLRLRFEWLRQGRRLTGHGSVARTVVDARRPHALGLSS